MQSTNASELPNPPFKVTKDKNLLKDGEAAILTDPDNPFFVAFFKNKAVLPENSTLDLAAQVDMMSLESINSDFNFAYLTEKGREKIMDNRRLNEQSEKDVVDTLSAHYVFDLFSQGMSKWESREENSNLELCVLSCHGLRQRIHDLVKATGGSENDFTWVGFSLTLPHTCQTFAEDIAKMADDAFARQARQPPMTDIDKSSHIVLFDTTNQEKVTVIENNTTTAPDRLTMFVVDLPSGLSKKERTTMLRTAVPSLPAVFTDSDEQYPVEEVACFGLPMLTANWKRNATFVSTKTFANGGRVSEYTVNLFPEEVYIGINAASSDHARDEEVRVGL